MPIPRSFGSSLADRVLKWVCEHSGQERRVQRTICAAFAQGFGKRVRRLSARAGCLSDSLQGPVSLQRRVKIHFFEAGWFLGLVSARRALETRSFRNAHDQLGGAPENTLDN